MKCAWRAPIWYFIDFFRNHAVTCILCSLKLSLFRWSNKTERWRKWESIENFNSIEPFVHRLVRHRSISSKWAFTLCCRMGKKIHQKGAWFLQCNLKNQITCHLCARASSIWKIEKLLPKSSERKGKSHRSNNKEKEDREQGNRASNLTLFATAFN